MNTPASKTREGFTLLEVLVSTAIMVVIVLTVVTIASDSLRVYDRAVADLSTQSEARGVLDAMENDFSTAVLRSDGRCWMEIVIPGGTGSPANSSFEVGNIHRIDQPIVMLFATPQDRPRWSTDSPRRQLRGDVCAVAYRIGQRSPFDDPGQEIQQIYGVYRTIVDPPGGALGGLPAADAGLVDDEVAPQQRLVGHAPCLGGALAPDLRARKLGVGRPEAAGAQRGKRLVEGGAMLFEEGVAHGDLRQERRVGAAGRLVNRPSEGYSLIDRSVNESPARAAAPSGASAPWFTGFS